MLLDRYLVRDEAPPAPARGDSHARSIAKAVSWRIAGSLDTFILALLITGSGAWSWVRWGRH